MPKVKKSGLDKDLLLMTKEELIAEVKKLRNAIREHRDATGHDLCWYHPKLWGLLPEKTNPLPAVPDWQHFMEGCVRFRKSLDKQLPDAKHTKEKFKGGKD